MTSNIRNRLLLLGVLWGLLLASIPAFVMADPFKPTAFLTAALACAALSGAAGTLAAGRRVARRASARKSGSRSRILASVGTGALQGLVGGAVAALLFWAMMAGMISGFTLSTPVEPSALMSPRVFLGSFFVALSAFVYVLVGGLVLAPLFGSLVQRVVRGAAKEDPLVR